MTFSIVAFDVDNRLIGSAVVSRWTGVGGCVPYFRPGVGIVHVQNCACAQVGHNVLAEMEIDDNSLERCLCEALNNDPSGDQRQCIVASIKNLSLHVYTGTACAGITHHKLGRNCAAAGNALANEDVIEAMVEAFESNADTDMAERLITALEAGQAEGGDMRGEEAAALKVYKLRYPVQRFHPVDLRVDHHTEPLKELRYLYEVFSNKERRFIR